MRLWRIDAPGRRGRFATEVAKSNDDASAVGTSDGIVSLLIFPWNPLSTLSFHQENSAIAEGLVLLGGRILESSELGVLCVCYRPSGLRRTNFYVSSTANLPFSIVLPAFYW